MTNKRKPKPVITPRQLERTIELSTRNLMAVGAAVLGDSFGFTDEQQAQWIIETSDRARDRVMQLSSMMEEATERLREKADE